MFLTLQRRPAQQLKSDKFPTAQLAILALVRASEPIALTSIFPYAWKLVLFYNVGSEHDAAFYAGLLIAAFSFSEALTGFFWGSLSDHIGRKKVLLFGNAGTLLSLLVVGFARTYRVALFGRIMGGLLNGNIGVLQTMVGELVTNPKHEPRAFAVMPFVWSIGTIIGPSIGGYFADPADNFPSVFPRDGLFGTFPYLLPNLICAFMLLASIFTAYFFLFETHPDMQPWSTSDDLKYTTANTPLIPTSGSLSSAPADISTQSYGTFDHVQITETSPTSIRERKPNSRESSISSPSRQKPFTKSVAMLIAALGIYTYHSMTYDHLMPIFFQDVRTSPTFNYTSPPIPTMPLAGGLGLTMQQVGLIMSFNGIIALFVQGLLFPLLASWLGVWRLFVIVTIGHPLAYFIVPYLLLLPTPWLYHGIFTALFIRNVFNIMAYPLLLILIKEACLSPSHLGKINGLAASVGGGCRTVASPVAGLLYGLGAQFRFAPLPWWASALVALAGAAQLPWIDRVKSKTALVRTAAAWAHDDEPSSSDGRGKATAAVRVHLTEVCGS